MDVLELSIIMDFLGLTNHLGPRIAIICFSHLDSPFVPIAPVTSPPSPFDRFDCLMGQMINLLGFGNHLKISDQNLKLIIQHCDHILS